jgi:hypothetical protein
MRATKPVYEKGIRVGEEPDWKERRENAAAHYFLQRVSPLGGNLLRAQGSKTLRRFEKRIRNLPSLQNTVQGEEVLPALSEGARE